eukprot:6173657-Pleurochrysis_carterae.AAC.1
MSVALAACAVWMTCTSRGHNSGEWWVWAVGVGGCYGRAHVHAMRVRVGVCAWACARGRVLVGVCATPPVCSSGQRLRSVAESGEMEESVGAVAFHGHNVEVASEVPRVGARDWKAVAQSREGRVCAVVAGGGEGGVTVEGGLGGREEVGEDARHVGARDAAALVGHLDHDVLVRLRVGDNHLRPSDAHT